jgi:hypothetical protein
VRKRCPYCKRHFKPNPRLKDRQKTCGRDWCQKERKRINAQKWREQNPDYDTQGYRKQRHRNRREWKRQYWATHPGYRKHHTEYMRQWRKMKKMPDQSVRVPYLDIEVTYCKKRTLLEITSVRVPYRVIEAILL